MEEETKVTQKAILIKFGDGVDGSLISEYASLFAWLFQQANLEAELFVAGEIEPGE